MKSRSPPSSSWSTATSRSSGRATPIVCARCSPSIRRCARRACRASRCSTWSRTRCATASRGAPRPGSSRSARAATATGSSSSCATTGRASRTVPARCAATASTTRASGCARCTGTAPRSSSSAILPAAPSRCCACRSTRCRRSRAMPADRRVLVADDEPSARRGVRQLLAAYPDYAVVGECRDGAEVLAALDTLSPDVVFLDVQMPGLDGFDVIARRTRARMPAVVFLTAYDHYALRAFEAEAVDYLMKPVSEARFAATMQRVGRVLAAAPTPPGLVVTTSRGQLIVELRAIDWIEAAGNY